MTLDQNELETLSDGREGAATGAGEDAVTLAGIAFVGETLGPFFMEDPQKGDAGQLFAAFAELDPASAAADWPFADESQAAGALALMTRGLANGCDEDLTWEYRRLFVGPQAKAAPPWGSVYTDHDRVTFGATERELRRWLREVGIRQLAENGQPADHIGLMLELMAWCARDKPSALDDLLRLHLLTWSSHFLDYLQENAAHPFYEGLAQLTRASLEGIRDARGLKVDYPRFYR